MEGSLFAPLMNSSRDSLPEKNQNRNDLFMIHICVHSIKLKKSVKCDCVGSINILSEIITISGLISYAYLVASLVQRLYNMNGTS